MNKIYFIDKFLFVKMYLQHSIRTHLPVNTSSSVIFLFICVQYVQISSQIQGDKRLFEAMAVAGG